MILILGVVVQSSVSGLVIVHMRRMMIMDNPLMFGWLPSFLTLFFGWLRGWQLLPGVSMFGFLLGLCLLIVVIRSMLLKG